MSKKYSIDLTEDLPVIEIKTKEATVELTLTDVWEYAMLGATPNDSLKDRIGTICKKLNEDYGINLSSNEAYLVLTKGLYLIEQTVGNF